jgi:hypothetical protein
MAHSAEQDGAPRSRQPLLAISLIVAVMLIMPAFLYSIAPEEPLKTGVVVFSNGRHRVAFAEPARYQRNGYESTCVLEPRDQLLIVQGLGQRPDGALLVQADAQKKLEFPFCPPQAEVVVPPHQVVQKESLWSRIRLGLAGLFSR